MTEHPPRPVSRQKERDELAESVRDVRRERDTHRAASQSWRARLGRLVGGKEARNERTAADHLHEDASTVLRRGKYAIAQKVHAEAAEGYERSVFGPLRAASAAESEGDAQKLLENLNSEEFRGMAADPRWSHALAHEVAVALRTGKPEAVKSILHLASELIGSQVDAPEPFFLEGRGIKLLSGPVLESLRPELKSKIMTRLETRPDLLREQLKDSNLELAQFFFEQNSKVGIEAFTSVCKEGLGVVWSNFADYALRSSSVPEMKALAEEIVAEYVTNTFSIPFEEIKVSWKAVDFPEFGSPAYLRSFEHLHVMNAVEQEVPGGVKKLYEEYGIQCFGRYPSNLLIDQLKEEAVDQPYGVIIFPRSDWNKAFEENNKPLGDLYDKTRGHHGLKVFEVASKQDMARHLLKLGRAYSNKISFALLGGHGTEVSIQLGDAPIKGSHIWRMDMKSPGVSRVSEFFEPNPTIMLASCSTGKEGGIGERMSSEFGAEVLGPDVPAHMKSIDVEYGEDGRPAFKVEYDSDSGRRYMNGEAVQSKQSEA